MRRNIMDRIYDKVGTKIKILVFFTTFCLCCIALVSGIVSSLVFHVWGLIAAIDLESVGVYFIAILYSVIPILAALLLCALIFLSSYLPYGIGQLIENSQKIVENTERIKTDKKHSDKERLVNLEAEKKARLAAIENARSKGDEKKAQIEAENIARIEKEQNDIKAAAEAEDLRAKGKEIIKAEEEKAKEKALWDKNRVAWESANELARKIREEMDSQCK